MMAGAAPHDLQQEVLLLREAACSTCSVQPPVPRFPCATTSALFSLRGRSGGALDQSTSNQREFGQQRGFQWQVDNGSCSALRLDAFDLSDGARRSMEVGFGSGVQVFPMLLQLQHSKSGATTLLGLLSTGMLFFWDVHVKESGGTMDLGEPMSMHFCDLSASLAAHGSPTALGSTADTVLIGCSDGVVLVVPASLLSRPVDAERHTAELRVSSWGLVPLLSSMISTKQQAPLVVACMGLPASPALALVVYDNCTLKVGNGPIGKMYKAAHHTRRQTCTCPQSTHTVMRPSNHPGNTQHKLRPPNAHATHGPHNTGIQRDAPGRGAEREPGAHVADRLRPCPARFPPQARRHKRMPGQLLVTDATLCAGGHARVVRHQHQGHGHGELCIPIRCRPSNMPAFGLQPPW